MSAPKKLLLVEDEAILALAEARVLRKAGYTVEIVHDGEAGVAAVQSNPSIDLVLMDIDLGPGMNGPETAALILKTRSLPVVFLTAHSEREMVDKVRNITRYGYIVKNSGNFVLLSSIEMAFELFEAHEDSRRHARRREAMLRAIPDRMFTVGLDGVIRDYSAPAGARLAIPADKIIGTNIREIFPPEEAEIQLSVFRLCLETGEVQTHSYEMWIDGRRRIFELRVVNQERDQVLTLVRDITERVESERQLRRATAQYEYLFEHAPVPIVLLDGDDHVVKANSTFIRTFGYSQEEASGRPINDLVVPPDLIEEGLDNTRRVASGESIHRETVRRRKDGTHIHVAITAAPIEMEGSFFIYAIYQEIP